jgi:polysaccharide pyruvyl transferase WcaK-like protein
MNISILASVGCQNLGDELILKNEIQLLRERYGQDTVFRVFSYDVENSFFEDESISYIEYFPVGIKDIHNLGRNIKNATSFFMTLLWSDLVVI